MKSMELDLAIIGGAAGLAAAAEAKRLLTTTVRTRGEPGEVVSGGDFRAGSQADPTRMHADDGWAHGETTDSVRPGDRLEPAPIGKGPDPIRSLVSSEIR